MIRAKSKKAAPDICPEISNKISTRGALFVVEATRQNVLKAFFLPSNRDKLPLVAIEATSSSLAGFSPVKVPSKKHTWVNSSVAFTPTKSPKVFNNRPVNKLVFPSIDSILGAASTTSSKKMVKKTKSSEKWEQLLVFAIVILNPFVVSNEILDEISIASSSTSSKIDQDQLLAVLPNVVSSSRSSPVLEAKQSLSVGLPVFGNWADQIETELSPPLVSGAISGGAWETITTSTLVSGATFKIKLAHIKAVFQSVHGFLGAKSVSKDNVKLFCVEFASQQFLEAVFLVELTSSVHLATFKIVKSLVVSESGSSPATVVLHDIPLGMSTADIKMALGVFGKVAHVVLKPAGVWQYMVVYFKELDAATAALNHWLILVDKDSVRILPVINQNKAPKMFNTCFVSGVSYAKASVPLNVSGFSFLVASDLLASPLAASFVAPVTDSTVELRLNSMEKQILDLTALVKSVIEPIGSLVMLVTTLLNDNAVKALKIEKDLLTMCNVSKGFADLLVGVSKDFASLKAEVEFGNLNDNDVGAVKTSLLSNNTIDNAVVLWQICGPKIKGSSEKTRLFFIGALTNSGGWSHVERV
ncbi:hypothetical protein G9A89_003862 [Geosiphon pyriformis]|nr:hypothetical protein G9A89_003862 [Geosiphon pyriformis]